MEMHPKTELSSYHFMHCKYSKLWQRIIQTIWHTWFRPIQVTYQPYLHKHKNTEIFLKFLGWAACANKNSRVFCPTLDGAFNLISKDRQELDGSSKILGSHTCPGAWSTYSSRIWFLRIITPLLAPDISILFNTPIILQSSCKKTPNCGDRCEQASQEILKVLNFSGKFQGCMCEKGIKRSAGWQVPTYRAWALNFKPLDNKQTNKKKHKGKIKTTY